MTIIKNHYNTVPFKGTVNSLPSKTYPDQSMSILEIIARTQKGLPVTGVKVPIYNETEDGILPDLRNMDLSEIHELKRRMQQVERDIRVQLQEEKEKTEQKQTEEFYKKKFGYKEPTQEQVEVEVVK